MLLEFVWRLCVKGVGSQGTCKNAFLANYLLHHCCLQDACDIFDVLHLGWNYPGAPVRPSYSYRTLYTPIHNGLCARFWGLSAAATLKALYSLRSHGAALCSFSGPSRPSRQAFLKASVFASFGKSLPTSPSLAKAGNNLHCTLHSTASRMSHVFDLQDFSGYFHQLRQFRRSRKTCHDELSASGQYAASRRFPKMAG